MFIIGDVHGCLKTLEALIDKLPNQDDIIFVGDLIDRGPSSKEVLDYIKDHPLWQVVRGNHEDMMLNFFLADVPSCNYPHNTWRRNGGVPELYTEAHVEWVSTWPLYLEFPDLKDNNGRHLFISHAAPHFEALEDCLDLQAWKRIDYNILWNRYPPPDHKANSKRFCVYGHNSEHEPTITESYAMIDTACAYAGRFGFKRNTHLTAMEFPSKKIYNQENIETVEETRKWAL